METQEIDTLTKELFHFDVKVTKSFGLHMAKWSNNKHPENPKFMQRVNWVALEMSNNTVCIKYYLDSTRMQDSHMIAVLPINSDTFETVVFNYWKDI